MWNKVRVEEEIHRVKRVLFLFMFKFCYFIIKFFILFVLFIFRDRERDGGRGVDISSITKHNETFTIKQYTIRNRTVERTSRCKILSIFQAPLCLGSSSVCAPIDNLHLRING